MLAYCYSPELEQYSDLLPSNLGRSKLTHRLASAYRLLAHPKLSILKPRPASRDDLLRYHSEAYVDALLTMDDGRELSDADRAKFGLEYDCAVFAGMSSYVRMIAGASIEAARALREQDNDVDIAVNWDGGRHHCKKASACGFCYVQDIVLAIQELRKTYDRVVYIDLDLHHGDGVEAAFVHSDKVFTISLHRHDPGFFPNSGAFHEAGRGKGKGYTLNIPLRRGLSDSSFMTLNESIVLHALDAYLGQMPNQAIVVQCGVDCLAGDPCKEWNVSIDGFCNAVEQIQKKANELHCKVLYLGGGGYDKALASRCYASILSRLLGQNLDDRIPEHTHWEEYADSNHELAHEEHHPGMVDENMEMLPDLVRQSNDRLDIMSNQRPKAKEQIRPTHDTHDWSSALGDLEGVVWHPPGRKTNVLVMMHGFGDNMDAFAQLGRSMNLPETVVLSIQGPHLVPLVTEGRRKACMWTAELMFDSRGEVVQDDGDFSHIRKSMHKVLQRILEFGIPSDRVIFFGLGQGGMIATDLATRYACHVINIGSTLPETCETFSGLDALVCAGDSQSRVSATSLSQVKKHFSHVSLLRWKNHVGDALPATSKKNSWAPIMSFLAKHIVQMKGIPDGAVQISR